MANNKAVRNADGKYLGSFMGSFSITWVPPQFANCYQPEQAEAAARHFGGEVVDVPKFDAKTKTWQ